MARHPRFVACAHMSRGWPDVAGHGAWGVVCRLTSRLLSNESSLASVGNNRCTWPYFLDRQCQSLSDLHSMTINSAFSPASASSPANKPTAHSLRRRGVRSIVFDPVALVRLAAGFYAGRQLRQKRQRRWRRCFLAGRSALSWRLWACTGHDRERTTAAPIGALVLPQVPGRRSLNPDLRLDLRGLCNLRFNFIANRTQQGLPRATQEQVFAGGEDSDG